MTIRFNGELITSNPIWLLKNNLNPFSVMMFLGDLYYLYKNNWAGVIGISVFIVIGNVAQTLSDKYRLSNLNVQIDGKELKVEQNFYPKINQKITFTRVYSTRDTLDKILGLGSLTLVLGPINNPVKNDGHRSDTKGVSLGFGGKSVFNEVVGAGHDKLHTPGLKIDDVRKLEPYLANMTSVEK